MLKNLVKAAGVSLVILSSSMYAQAADAAQKIAYINTAKVFQALPQREVELQKMQDEFKDRANELKSLKEEIKTKVEKLKRDSSLMSSDEVEKLRIDIGQLDSTYKIKAQALDKASTQAEAQAKHKLFKIIQNAVAKIAKKEGYDFVIDVQMMQYGNSAYDISDQVIKQLK